MSDLEKEFELEMEGFDSPSGETGDNESDQEFELEMEGFDSPSGETDERTVNELAQRLLELSTREYEMDSESNLAIDGVMREIETRLFWGKLKKLGKFVVPKLLSKLAGNLVPGLSAFKAIKAATQLVRMFLSNGQLKSLLISALRAHPAGAAAYPVLKILGIAETAQDSESNIETWKNFVRLSEAAYDYVLKNMNEAAVKDPTAASKLAAQAFQSAASKYRSRARLTPHSSRRKRYVISVRPGQRKHLHFIVKGLA